MPGTPSRALVIVGLSLCAGAVGAEASNPEIALSLVPLQYTFVDGDSGKFRAHHWRAEGYSGGVEEFSGKYTFPDGSVFETEGHALIDQNDIGTELSLTKDAVGFVNLDYQEFRKYFDGNGGVHRRFKTLQAPDTDHDLRLDIGKLGLETGLTLEGMPELTFFYEREFKDGAKSRLSWASVKDDGETRKIGPSWQDIDEIVDSFGLKATHELAGFALSGEQRWEQVRSESFRVEQNLSTSGVASDTKIRTQDQAPESNLMTTTLGAERSFLEEKVFVASGYHFAHMDNREFETLAEYNAAGVPTNFSNPEQKPNSRADNDYDTHTWVGNVMIRPWQWLSFGTKLKSEVVKKESNSTYRADLSPNSATGSTPNGVIDEVDQSLTDTKAVRWGEGFSVRFTGLPRTALYTELELEQVRLLLREDRQDVIGNNANELFSRRTVTEVRRGAWTLGGHAAPWAFLDLTAHVRHRINNNDYDDQQETSPGSSTAKSAFFDGQSIHTNEFATRATFKPCRWFRSSFRYQFRDDDYSTRVENEPIVKTGSLSHIYTYDVVLQPLKTLLTTMSFSRQNAWTTTPAALNATVNIPTFNADVNTWLLSMDYTPIPQLTLTNSLLYSRADNFNDFANTGLPLGVDNERVDLTTGLQWALAENLSVEGEYAFYHYQANSNAEFGDYNAHVIWLRGSVKF